MRTYLWLDPLLDFQCVWVWKEILSLLTSYHMSQSGLGKFYQQGHIIYSIL